MCFVQTIGIDGAEIQRLNDSEPKCNSFTGKMGLCKDPPNYTTNVKQKKPHSKKNN